MLELKSLSREGVPGALAKGERYRLLNEPEEAESIYLDVLGVEPDNQEAVIGLLLALTDQFDHRAADCANRARELLPRLAGEYERAYYAGVICERRARSQLRRGGPGAASVAYEWLREAKSWFEKAEPIRPTGNDDVVLRWNACVRLMTRHPAPAAVSSERYEPYRD